MDEEFNQKMGKSNLGAGWEQNNRFYRFQRYDNNNSQFVEPERASGLAAVFVGLLCIFALLVILLFIGAY